MTQKQVARYIRFRNQYNRMAPDQQKLFSDTINAIASGKNCISEDSIYNFRLDQERDEAIMHGPADTSTKEWLEAKRAEILARYTEEQYGR